MDNWGPSRPEKTLESSQRRSQTSFAQPGRYKNCVIGNDERVRIFDTTTGQHIFCVQCEYNPFRRDNVVFSGDGDFVIYNDFWLGETKIWKTQSQELVFHSNDTSACPRGLSENEAVSVVRDCGSKSIYMLPKSSLRVAGDVVVRDNGVVRDDGVYVVEGNDVGDFTGCKTKLLAVNLGGRARFSWEFSPVQGTLMTIEHDRLFIARLLYTRRTTSICTMA